VPIAIATGTTASRSATPIPGNRFIEQASSTPADGSPRASNPHGGHEATF
jgi:hypothetical protein